MRGMPITIMRTSKKRSIINNKKSGQCPDFLLHKDFIQV